MAQILIKRDIQSVIDGATLLNGELAVALDTGNVYIGTTAGKHLINPTTTDEATRLKTARTIGITGDGAWSTTFDGSANVTGELTLADTAVTAGEYGNITVDAKGRLTAARAAVLADVTDAGTAAALDAGITKGNVVVLGENGKLDAAVIPSLALTDTYVVADEAAMIALAAEQGDIAIRSDEGKTYVLVNNEPATVANWVWLKTPESPVSSVNGKTGEIVIAKADLGLEKAENTADAEKVVLSASLLTTARKIGISGAVTVDPAPTFDGSADINLVAISVDASKLAGVIDCGVISEMTPPEEPETPEVP